MLIVAYLGCAPEMPGTIKRGKDMNETHEEYKEWYDTELGAFNAKAQEVAGAAITELFRLNGALKAEAEKATADTFNNIFLALLQA